MNIADRIDLAMKLAAIESQAELSRLSGVPTSTIARILSNDSKPNITNLLALARACNQSLEWIITGETSTRSSPSNIELIYCTHEEIALLTLFRQSTEFGQQFVKSAAKTAEKKSTTGLTTHQS
jgi:transcriptional regulator with XRE-family HTH domain